MFRVLQVNIGGVMRIFSSVNYSWIYLVQYRVIKRQRYIIRGCMVEGCVSMLG